MLSLRESYKFEAIGVFRREEDKGAIVAGQAVGSAVLGRDGAAGVGFWTAGELGVGAIGGELSVGDGSDGFGSIGGDDRLSGSGRRLYRRLYRLRRGEAGFAG